MPNVYIETYGCQMNVADTELIRGHLARSGYRSVSQPEDADVIILNTCAIRDHAEEKIYGRLGTLVQHKQRRPHVQIGLAGCMAQHFRDNLLDKTPHVDFVTGPDAYRRLPELLVGDPFVDVRLDKEETYADVAPDRSAGVRAWVTVMRGCDKFCTFCIVPYVRGRERSLPAAVVLEQVREAASDGYREVVFLGQTVNAYRDGDFDFGDLLRATNDIAGIERIRFTSPHPSDMSDSAIDAMANCEKVCPQLHLPLQSGSDAVLRAMERGYTVAHYLDLVDRLRRAVPGIALSTDMIVGFPGETADDFEQTLELMRRVRYDSAFMFKYSRRSHTKAGKWEETVSEQDKGERLQRMIALQEETSAEINRAEIGTMVEVLVEGPARRNDDWLAGKSAHFKTTVFPSDGTPVGGTTRVRIADSTGHTLIGGGPLAGADRCRSGAMSELALSSLVEICARVARRSRLQPRAARHLHRARRTLQSRTQRGGVVRLRARPAARRRCRRCAGARRGVGAVARRADDAEGHLRGRRLAHHGGRAGLRRSRAGGRFGCGRTTEERRSGDLRQDQRAVHGR